jgi:hypothetical protein
LTVESLLPVVVDATIAGGAIAVYVACILPQLRWQRASAVGVVVSAFLAAAVPLSLALRAVTPVPFLVSLLAWALLVAIWTWPAALIRVTGGRRPMSRDAESAFAIISQAIERFDVGDVEGAAAILRGLDAHRSAQTSRYVDLWQRYGEEELGRRAGRRESSRQTREEISSELRSMMAGRGIGRRAAWTVVVVAALVGATPAMARAGTCLHVTQLLPQRASPASREADVLAAALLAAPEPGARLVYDGALDLDAAVEAKVDPESRRQLVDAGFVAGYERFWEAADGRPISSDVLEFRDAAGALSFQRGVNLYACRFSTEAFRGPGHGIGLRTSWSRGDPISEQVSWTDGTRRFVVSIRYLTAPEDHLRVLGIAERALER